MRDSKQGIDGSGTRLPRVLRRTLAAAGVALAIVGCGDLSLVNSLQKEAPGPLRVSPPDPVIPLNTALTFTVMGGIPPYALVSGSANPVDDHTWKFPAQASSGDFPIQVSDWAGKTVRSDVRVTPGAPALNVTGVTLPVGVGWTFTVVSGGVAPFSWELDGVFEATGSSYLFSSAAIKVYVITVIDSLGASQVATAEVVPSGINLNPLSITPASAVMLPWGTVALTALGGSGFYHFSVPSSLAGSIVDANPATYTAPAGTGTYTITLTDTGGGQPASVTANAIVTATGSLPVITPSSVTVAMVGDTVQFTTSGGTLPYTYTTNKPTIGSVDPVTGLYKQEGAGPVLVTVSDKDGLVDKATVKWKP